MSGKVQPNDLQGVLTYSNQQNYTHLATSLSSPQMPLFVVGRLGRRKKESARGMIGRGTRRSQDVSSLPRKSGAILKYITEQSGQHQIPSALTLWSPYEVYKTQYSLLLLRYTQMKFFSAKVYVSSIFKEKNHWEELEWVSNPECRFDLNLYSNNPNPKQKFELVLNPNHYFQGLTLNTLFSAHMQIIKDCYYNVKPRLVLLTIQVLNAFSFGVYCRGYYVEVLKCTALHKVPNSATLLMVVLYILLAVYALACVTQHDLTPF